MRLATGILLAAFCLVAFGCNKDSEVDSFLREWDALTKEMVQKINAGDIDGARTAFEGKKVDLKSKLTVLQAAKDRVSADALKRFDERFASNQMGMTAAYFNNWKKLVESGDTEKMEKLKALVNEYGSVFGTHGKIN